MSFCEDTVFQGVADFQLQSKNFLAGKRKYLLSKISVLLLISSPKNANYLAILLIFNSYWG